tara:strand:+ start:210 stop:404 length:195 start_codon:yes stop_codon:yes gene_type:complete
VAKCFGAMGWDKKLSELSKDEVLGLVSVIQKVRDLSDEYTEQGLFELEKTVSSPDEFPDDEIPF